MKKVLLALYLFIVPIYSAKMRINKHKVAHSQTIHKKNKQQDKSSLEHFAQVYVKPSEKRMSFLDYYSDFIDRMSRMGKKRKHKKLNRLRQEALFIMKIKNPELYQQLEKNNQLDPKNQTRTTRLCLIRYRLLEDFEEYQATRHAYVWHKTKHTLSKAAHSISSAFKTAATSMKEFFTTKKA